MTLAERFGENLKAHRKQAGLSQAELARRASLDQSEISHLERGQRVARLETVIKLSGALSIAPGDLLKGVAWNLRSGRYGFQEPGERDQ